MSELEEIRVALKLTQQEFAPLLGAASHSAITRWENAPNTRSSLQALAKAKVVFEKKTGRKWESGKFVAIQQPQVTGVLPGRCAAEAWLIIRDAAVATETDLTIPALVEVVEELFDSVATAIAQGRIEEARQRLLRKAEVTFQALKK